MSTATVITNFFVTTYQDAVAMEATIAERAWGEVFGRAMRAVAGCFARREARATAAGLVAGAAAGGGHAELLDARAGSGASGSAPAAAPAFARQVRP
jgi:hypothetical protein